MWIKYFWIFYFVYTIFSVIIYSSGIMWWLYSMLKCDMIQIGLIYYVWYETVWWRIRSFNHYHIGTEVFWKIKEELNLMMCHTCICFFINLAWVLIHMVWYDKIMVANEHVSLLIWHVGTVEYTCAYLKWTSWILNPFTGCKLKTIIN